MFWAIPRPDNRTGLADTMNPESLQTIIDDARERRDAITPATKGEIADAIQTTLDELDIRRPRVRVNAGGAGPASRWPSTRRTKASTC